MKGAYYIKSFSSISPQPTFGTEGQVVLTTPGEETCFTALEPDYKAYISDAGLRRRMSRIIKMGVAAGLESLGSHSADAIITATGLGCVADTEKFIRSIEENGERLLNPTAFIQSTFNTIGAQIALITTNRSYNTTHVHRSLSFENALTDAMLHLCEPGYRNILVGAFDERVSIQEHIMERIGCWRTATPGEGTQFFLLSCDCEDEPGASVMLRDIAVKNRLSGTDELKEWMDCFLRDNGLNAGDLDLILLGDNKKQKDEFYDAVRDLMNKPEICFKRYCGEYYTATSFALWLSCALLQEKISPTCDAGKVVAGECSRILIYNHCFGAGHSLYLVERR